MKDIDWREWGNEAFEEARSSGKPVLLSISAVWCHWCHVMDSTTYSEPAVVAMINEQFVPVRVDNDRNPDINTRYNMGGWPTTAFLTHNRDVLAGATYIPPAQMVEVLRSVVNAYGQAGESLVSEAREHGRPARSHGEPGPARTVGEADVEAVLEFARRSYDRHYGGFGQGQKFPAPGALELLMMGPDSEKREADLRIVMHTLDSMIAGEIFDPVEGGMFRYATRRDWTEPHYEKMLGDNARIAQVLLEAYSLTGNEEYRRVGDGVASYMLTVLRDPASGLFSGSQDADEEYYKRDAAGRREMTPPRVDIAAYTDTNAVSAISLLKKADINGDGEAREIALEIVRFLNSLPPGPDGTAPRYFENGEARGWGNLADHAWLALANAECAAATGEAELLRRAEEMAGLMALFASENGGLYDITAARAEDRGLHRSGTPMDDNAVAARLLLRLDGLTGHATYRRLARTILDSFTPTYADHGIMSSDYAVAVSRLLLAEPAHPE